MSTISSSKDSVVLPSQEEIELASSTFKELSSVMNDGPCTLYMTAGATSKKITIPMPAVRLLARALEELSKGNSVDLLSQQTELTTNAAADLLNVSRPTLIGILDDGKIPYRRLNSHRRIRLVDLMRYKEQLYKDRSEALDELTSEAERLDLGY